MGNPPVKGAGTRSSQLNRELWVPRLVPQAESTLSLVRSSPVAPLVPIALSPLATGSQNNSATGNRQRLVIQPPKESKTTPVVVGPGDVKKVEQGEGREAQRERLNRAGVPVIKYDYPIDPEDSSFSQAVDTFGDVMLSSGDLPSAMLRPNEPSGFLRGKRTRANPTGMPGGIGYSGPVSTPGTAFGHNLGAALVPAVTGALAGASLGAVGGWPGSIIGGVIGGFGGGVGQDYLIGQRLSPKAYQLYQEAMARDKAKHPVASFLGSTFAQLVTGKPNLRNVGRAAKFATQVARKGGVGAASRELGPAFAGELKNFKTVGSGAVINTGQEALGQIKDRQFNPYTLGLSFVTGGILNEPTAFSKKIQVLTGDPIQRWMMGGEVSVPPARPKRMPPPVTNNSPLEVGTIHYDNTRGEVRIVGKKPDGRLQVRQMSNNHLYMTEPFHFVRRTTIRPPADLLGVGTTHYNAQGVPFQVVGVRPDGKLQVRRSGNPQLSVWDRSDFKQQMTGRAPRP